MKRTGIKNREINENKGVPSLSKTTVLFILLIILGIVGIILVVFYVSDSTSMTINEKSYQYYYNTPVEYDAGVSVSSEYMEIIENDERESIDYTPFYSKSDKRIYLPRNYGWVDPSDDSIYRIPEFTSITYGSDYLYRCTSNRKDYVISGGFLYDGYDTYNYVFFDNGNIMLDDKSYNVGPLCFFSKTYEKTRIYIYDRDELILIDDNFSSASYRSSAGYMVDLDKGIFISKQGEKILLASSPSTLTSIEERSE